VVAFIKSLSAVGQKEQGPADAQDELAAQGQRLAESLGCLACHSVDGSQGIGPGWQGLYGKTQTLADGSQIKVDEGYLKDSVRHPGAAIVKGYAAVMPTFTPNDKELDALIAFIKSKAAVDADAGKVESGKSP